MDYPQNVQFLGESLTVVYQIPDLTRILLVSGISREKIQKLVSVYPQIRNLKFSLMIKVHLPLLQGLNEHVPFHKAERIIISSRLN